MSLEGNLSSFGLSEILQLIAVQQKTGMLAITRQSSSMKLFFREGKIISTRDRRRSARDPFSDYLSRYGISAREELARLSEISAKSKLDITDVMVSEGLFDQESLQRHYHHHVQETVHDILTWEQCSYRFIAGHEIIDGVKALCEIGVEGLLMESMRRIDEFPQILAEFPDGEMIVRRSDKPAEGLDLMRTESSVYELLSEERSINDIAARAGIPRFDTYEALRHLKEKDLIEVEGSRLGKPELDIEKTLASKRRKRPRRNPLPMFAAVVIFAACCAWGVRQALPVLMRHVPLNTAGANAPEKTDLERDQIEMEIRWSLEKYRADFGAYPAALSALKAKNLATDSLLERAGRYSFRYYLTPETGRYTLL
jgi:hypothetical protein